MISAIVAIRRGASTDDEPFLLDPWNDGDYDGGHLRVYAGTFPHPETDVLLIDATLATPAVGTVVGPYEVILTSVEGTVLVQSLAAVAKYVVITTPGDTDPYYMSLGTGASTFTPDIVISTLAWYEDETLDFDDIHVVEIPDPVVAYAGVVSDDTPESGGNYTTTFQAIDGGAEEVDHIGRVLAVTVVGLGDPPPEVTPATAITNQHGEVETLTNTAGEAGENEHTHVVDGVIASDGPTVVPIISNRILTWTTIDFGDAAAGGGDVTSAILDIPAGSVIKISYIDLYHNAPVFADVDGVALDPQPATLEEGAHVTGSSGGHLTLWSAFLSDAFNGTIVFDPGGGAHCRIIEQGVPNFACSDIQVVPANTVTMSDVTGAVVTGTLTYPQAFSEVQNAGCASWANYTPRSATPKVGWTETGDVFTSTGGCPLGLEAQYKTGGDTTAQTTWMTAPVLVWGVAVEFEALP